VSRVDWLLRRSLFAVVAAYAVMTAAFLVVALTPDPNAAQVAHIATRQGKSPEEVEALVESYRAARNLDDPVLERWVAWLVDVTTLDWGLSYSAGAPVTAVVVRGLRHTLLYAVPGAVLSLVGVLVGTHAAARRGSLLDRVESTGSYLAFGVPNFWIAQLSVVFLGVGAVGAAPAQGVESTTYAAAALVLATGLFAATMRYARAESLEYYGTDLVRTVRAKGAGRVRVARHVLRNTAVPLMTLFSGELVGVLVLNVFVIEYVFGIPGLGRLTYTAVTERDMPLVLGTTMVVAFVGIGGNLLQDALYTAIDPRVGDE
jgi:peptide/nickel transport system permease protein